MRLACFAAVFVIGFSCVAAADEAQNSAFVAGCDRAAANPFDANKPAGIAGVATEKIESSSAIAACQWAVEAVPADDRMVMQLGRAFLAAKNYDAARMQFDKANRMGNALAATELAAFYARGLGGLPADDTEALRLLKRAADAGISVAQLNLGYFYQYGRGGLAKDESEAARLYKLAADQGYPFAQNNLGTLYQEGIGGIPHDDAQAAHYYKLAADQGNSLGQSNLAVFYRDGRGGLAKDDVEAARLFKLAADQGVAPALANLGKFYQDGRGGLAKDDVRAGAPGDRQKVDGGSPSR
jgi:hypothetical protein